ncbi:hypothetical protein AA313_de0208353 [Arthrobotrys entomopaga]|nr:hypothetical protein AA313_de0208353 [Arthrobotrys entomopaga]
MSWKMSRSLLDKISHYSRFPATPVSLRQMVQFGQNPSPVYGNGNNGAKRVAAAGRYVPDNTKPTPGLREDGKQRPQDVDDDEFEHSRYYATIDEGVRWPSEILDYNKKFTDTLKTIKRRHDPVLTTVALGINEYKKQRQKTGIDDTIQSFLDRFYMSRIGIRMLIGQHVALNEQPRVQDHVGIICTKTNVKELAEEAIDNARYICENYYGLFQAPQVQLVCKDDLNFMYVPGHLSHMLFETIKNSLRAVVETHGVDEDNFPAVKVIVAEGREDITIKISDEGGGIPRSAIPLVWTYMYTTVDKTPSIEPGDERNDFQAPLAGFGYGLPISRLYARYFGGDLKLISMEGYGTDVYLHLNRLSTSSEPLN